MIGGKMTNLLLFALTILKQATGQPHHAQDLILQNPPVTNAYPNRTIANVTVIDTPVVRAAQDFARTNSNDFVYKHVMRSWLLGSLIVAANATLQQQVDLEVHAVATLLHDLGWDRRPNSTFVSKDKRFEVDGAIAAREFLRSHPDGRHWDEQRVQLVWDSIALHAEPSIADYKEAGVAIASKGILMDFSTPTMGVTEEQFDSVLGEFPRTDLRNGVNDTIIWLCQTKPNTTYDIWQQAWGERYVPKYSTKGHLIIDTIFADL